MHDSEGTLVTVGARVLYQRGFFGGAPWFPGTVTYLYNEDRAPTQALVQDDQKGINKYGAWVESARMKVIKEAS
jgi:hypothetical protein